MAVDLLLAKSNRGYCDVITNHISKLEKIAGIDVFPATGDAVKSSLMRLPEPKGRKHKGGR